MASTNKAALEAAYKDGLFDRALKKSECEYINPSVSSVHKVLCFVRKNKESKIEQIVEEICQNENTVRGYVRWLRQKKMVTTFYEGVCLVVSPIDS